MQGNAASQQDRVVLRGTAAILERWHHHSLPTEYKEAAAACHGPLRRACLQTVARVHAIRGGSRSAAIGRPCRWKVEAEAVLVGSGREAISSDLAVRRRGVQRQERVPNIAGADGEWCTHRHRTAPWDATQRTAPASSFQLPASSSSYGYPSC